MGSTTILPAKPERWYAHGTTIFFGDGGCCIEGAPDAERRVQLIAAAPELLAALQDMLEHSPHYPEDPRPEFDRACEDAAAAIAKATRSAA